MGIRTLFGLCLHKSLASKWFPVIYPTGLKWITDGDPVHSHQGVF